MTVEAAVARPSLGAVRGVLRRVLQKDPDAHVVAITWERPWGSEPVPLDGFGRAATIHRSDSPLAIRELLETAPPSELVVLLTACDDRTLGADLLSRVSFHKLHEPDRWEAVLQVFGALRHVRALNGLPELADALVDLAPASGYAPLLSGTLDVDTAWRTWARHALRLQYIDPGSLMRASASGELAVRTVSPTLLEQFAAWVGNTSGALASVLLRVEDRLDTGGAMGLAMVASVLLGADEPKRLFALGQLTELLGVPLATTDLEALRTLTGDVSFDSSPRSPVYVGDRAMRAATDLVQRLQLGAWVGASDLLPEGFEARIAGFGRQLQRALDHNDAADAAALDEAAAACRRHRLSADHPSRLELVEMAARARRALQIAPPAAGSFGVTAGRYALDGSWLDVAYRRLWAGDTDRTLQSALTELTARIADRQRADYRQFAQTLPGDDPSGRYAAHEADQTERTVQLIAVERVLHDVVAAIARQVPVLLIVLDGCSLPVHNQILGDVLDAEWTTVAPSGVHQIVGVAVLPTVTDVSRASLLTGMLTTGGPDAETRGFKAAMATVQAGARLFHHGELAGTAGAALSETVEDAILGRDKAVGVVINTIDDTLSKGTFPASWSLGAVGLLGDVLRIAADAGRVVVITADHGHRVQQALVRRAPPESGGERWRPVGAGTRPALGPHEVLVQGPRVLRGDGSVVLPWFDDVRYAPKKGGYHGGASPAEVLVPITVLTNDVVPDGWAVTLMTEPTWWNPGVAAPAMPPARVGTKPRPAQEALFAADPPAAVASAAPPWVSALLDSELWTRRAAGRRPIDRATLIGLFSAFADRGGVLSFGAIAEVTGVLVGRIPGFIASLAQQCNVEGFAILTSDTTSSEARLDVALLRAQFQLPSDRR